MFKTKSFYLVLVWVLLSVTIRVQPTQAQGMQPKSTYQNNGAGHKSRSLEKKIVDLQVDSFEGYVSVGIQENGGAVYNAFIDLTSASKINYKMAMLMILMNHLRDPSIKITFFEEEVDGRKIIKSVTLWSSEL